MPLLDSAWRFARDGAERALNQETVRLAVTGLSQAGKTVFITAMIADLLALGRGRDTLPLVSARLGGRLRGVRIEPAGVQPIPWFDAGEKLRDLAAATPHWPARTDDLAMTALSIEIERPGRMAWLGGRRLRLEVLDYPGEWLLDLPLLDQDFAEWSAGTLALLRQPPRLEVARPFLDFLAALPPEGPADDATARHGFTLYRAALAAMRDRHGLRFLQPGRFLRPGPRGETPVMWFFPFEGGRRPGSLGALLAARFDAYRQDMRENFFDSWFARFDRQVVLVDALGALCAGEPAFTDTRRALAAIAEGFTGRLGGGVMREMGEAVGLGAPTRWLERGLGLGGAGRVAFLASKADHVPAASRRAFADLLTRMTATPPGAGTVLHDVVAALRCTEDGIRTATVSLPGDAAPRQVERPVVIGVPLGEDRRRPFDPGTIPSEPPSPGDPFWARPYFELPVFRPPLVDPHGQDGLPHLNLDRVLAWLLEDLLA